jgi:hypothetical protein
MIDALGAVERVKTHTYCCTRCSNAVTFIDLSTAPSALLYRITIYRVNLLQMSALQLLFCGMSMPDFRSSTEDDVFLSAGRLRYE